MYWQKYDTVMGLKINAGEESKVTANEYEEKVYRVLKVIWAIPHAPVKVVLEKSSVNIEELCELLDYISNEHYMRGISVTCRRPGKAGIPFYDNATITSDGLEFLKRFEMEGIPHIKKENKPTVFISYNWDSSSSFVDDLQTALEPCANTLRDTTSLEDWESFSNFMKSIRKQDFVVMVITPSYLKSEACMNEVCELLKDDDWLEKAMFVVLDNSIYSQDVSEYLKYWQQRQADIEAEAEGLTLQNKGSASDKVNRIIAIQQCLRPFYSAVCDAKNPKPWMAIQSILQRIRFDAVADFSDGLDDAPYAKANQEAIDRALL